MYKTEIVTFIDILGFREMVKSRSAEEVDRAIKLIRAFGQHDDRDPLGVRSISFSDSVVRMRPIDQPGATFFELLDLVVAQGELVNLGIFIRGGVTFGHIAENEGRVFGPAFVEAYDLESRSAVYPRIIVSPGLLRACARAPFVTANDERYELAHIKELLKQGDDGLWYIDYLSAFPGEMDDLEMVPRWLKQHKAMVERLAGHGGTDLGLGVKANWLGRYHNHFVDELKPEWLDERGISIDEIRIESANMRTLHVFPDDLPGV